MSLINNVDRNVHILLCKNSFFYIPRQFLFMYSSAKLSFVLLRIEKKLFEKEQNDCTLVQLYQRMCVI